jgi:hypothetical protein
MGGGAGLTGEPGVTQMSDDTPTILPRRRNHPQATPPRSRKIRDLGELAPAEGPPIPKI